MFCLNCSWIYVSVLRSLTKIKLFFNEALKKNKDFTEKTEPVECSLSS